jgi:hypothetical protein
MTSGVPTRAALRHELRRLALELADRLMEAFDELGIWDEHGRFAVRPHAAEAESAPGHGEEARRVRRPDSALRAIRDRVVVTLQHLGAPAPISAIARRLGMNVRALAHPLALLVQGGRVAKTGTRRGTKYAVVSTRGKTAKPVRPDLHRKGKARRHGRARG